MALLPLEEEDPRVHADGAPLDRLRHLPLSLLHVLTVPAELDEVQAVVEDGFVLESVVDLLMMNISVNWPNNEAYCDSPDS